MIFIVIKTALNLSHSEKKHRKNDGNCPQRWIRPVTAIPA